MTHGTRSGRCRRESLAENSADQAIGMVRDALASFDAGEISKGELLGIVVAAAKPATSATQRGWPFLDQPAFPGLRSVT